MEPVGDIGGAWSTGWSNLIPGKKQERINIIRVTLEAGGAHQMSDQCFERRARCRASAGDVGPTRQEAHEAN